MEVFNMAKWGGLQPNSPVGKPGYAGPGRPKGNGLELEMKTLAEVEKKCGQQFGLGENATAELAHAAIVANRNVIYQAFGKALVKGDPKVLIALASLAYGLPKQDIRLSRTNSRFKS